MCYARKSAVQKHLFTAGENMANNRGIFAPTDVKLRRSALGDVVFKFC